MDIPYFIFCWASGILMAMLFTNIFGF